MAINLSWDIPTVMNMEALKATLYNNLMNLDKMVVIVRCVLLYFKSKIRYICDIKNVVSKQYKQINKELNTFFIDFVVESI